MNRPGPEAAEASLTGERVAANPARAADPAVSTQPSPAEGAETPVISIITVVYKTPEYLRRSLDFLERARIALPWEAIIIDNAPQEGDCRSIAEGRPGVRYVANRKNVGFGRACNQGMRLARGRYYLLLNPDMEVLPGSIETLSRYLDSEPDVGIVAPRLHYGDGRLQESCRTFYTLPIFLLRRTFLGKLFPNARIIRQHLMTDWDHEETRQVDWCIGASLLVRREAVDDVGMMDERFFMYFEDVDWCYRMHQRGWRVIYLPASRMIHHYQRASAGWKPSRGLMIHLGSTLLYYEKWSFLLYWLKQRRRVLRKGALFLSDLVMVAVAFLGAYAIRSLASGLLTKPLFAFELYHRFLAFTIGVAMASLIAFGLYRERLRASWVDNGLPVARALAWTSMLMMAATFLFSVRIFSRLVVALFFPLAVLLVTAGRVALLRAVDSVRNRDLNLHRIGIIGPPEAVRGLLERFQRLGRFGMEPVPMSQPGGALGAAPAWIQRVRAERVQEVILFEDWAGDVKELLGALHRQGIPVRLIPALRGVLPVGSALTEFMGLPAVTVGGASRRMQSPTRRLIDLSAWLAFGLLWLVPFLLAVSWRALSGRPVLETVQLRGRGGRPITVRRLARASAAGAASADNQTVAHRAFAAHILEWYPALSALARGDLSLIGPYAFPEALWESLDLAVKARPPDVSPGLLGPWVGREWDAAALAQWNQDYPERWSPAEDFRIFGRSVLGFRERDAAVSNPDHGKEEES